MTQIVLDTGPAFCSDFARTLESQIHDRIILKFKAILELTAINFHCQSHLTTAALWSAAAAAAWPGRTITTGMRTTEPSSERTSQKPTPLVFITVERGSQHRHTQEKSK